MEVEPKELAEQLTLEESALFRRVKPMECMDHVMNWQTRITGDSVAFVIERSEKVRSTPIAFVWGKTE
jgi:RasGEF domain